MILKFQNLLLRRYIRHAFKNLKIDVYGGLIQFWAPTKNASRWILTTSSQPFLVGDEDDDLRRKYMLCSRQYKYDLKEPTIISTTAAPATAFLNRMPELLASPLESSALERGFMYSFVLPVFYPSQNCCAGVVEYFTSSSHHLLHVFNKLITELEKVGLETFQAQEHLPYEIVCGLKHAQNKIDDALKCIEEMQSVVSAQVWIACQEKSHVAFTSLEDTGTKQSLGLKLTGHHIILDDEDFELQQKRLTDYGKSCYSLPLKMDEGLLGKTLDNYEPYFILNNSELSHNNKPQRLLSMCFDYSCFVIYLMDTNTSDLVYVFEFLWNHKHGHNVILFESLLLTLKRCLPSFKIASGADLGDEIDIFDVENYIKREKKYFKIFQTNKLSPIPVTPKRGRTFEECLLPSKAKCKTTLIPLSEEDIVQQFGKTMMEAAKSLNVSLSTLKRKCKALGITEWPRKEYSKRSVKHSYKCQSNTNEEDYGGAVQDPTANNRETYLDENTLTIKAVYVDDMIKFHLPISATTFGAIEMEISEGFKLNPSDYKIKYLDEDGDWILLSSEKDMRVCIQNHINLNISTIKMQVLLRKL